MIQIKTILKINDNSGIKTAKCIKIYKNKKGKIGYNLLISVKNLRLNQNKNQIKKGDLFKAILIQTKYIKKNTINNYIKFDKNSVIILNNQNQPIGTRILGPISSEFRKKKNFKILSISSNII